MELYHASDEVVEFPEIRKGRYPKDFSWGFYCTNSRSQAHKWAIRHANPVVNIFEYTENPVLRIKRFPAMSEEWLDFIAQCRGGWIHDYDIVEGPMADDTVWNYVQEFVDGTISRAAFWELVQFRYPTLQMSFHTLRAIACLRFIKGATAE